jgi:membrane protein
VNEHADKAMTRQKIIIRRNEHEKSGLSPFLFHPQQIWVLTQRSVVAWVDDYASSMGAALAYYTLFAIAPLLIIAIAVAGLVFGQEAARGEVVAQIQGLIGREGAIVVQGLLKSANDPARNIFATMVSTITLLIGATTVFAELQSDLDRIWRVPAPEKANGMWTLLRTHLLSFGLVLGLGFLMLVSLLLSAAIAAFGKWSSVLFEGWEALLNALNVSISFVITTLLFAMIYRFMPRARIAWRDVWVGAAVTAILFEVGKLLIGLYLGTTSLASGFGAAGSLVVLLVWVYFSAQIFLLGAEFTWVYAHEYGSKATQLEQKSVTTVPSRSVGVHDKKRRGSALDIG